MDRHDGLHLPSARLHLRVRRHDLARHRQQQRHRMIGDLVDAVVRHLGDDDARAGRRREIDVVDADAEARDDPAAGHLPDHVRRDLRVGDEQRVGARGDFQDRFRRRAARPAARPRQSRRALPAPDRGLGKPSPRRPRTGAAWRAIIFTLTFARGQMTRCPRVTLHIPHRDARWQPNRPTLPMAAGSFGNLLSVPTGFWPEPREDIRRRPVPAQGALR